MKTKSSSMYWLTVILWALLSWPLALAAHRAVTLGLRHSTATGVLVSITAVFISYFWLNGLKDLIYPLMYRTGRHTPLPKLVNHFNAVPIALLYCTCNDFNGASLAASMEQDYEHCTTIILDDSSKPEYRAQVDEFAARYNVEVVRRSNNVGFKAGNLNNWLQSAAAKWYPYFVILDSDEIIPPYFVERCLDYFAANKQTGIVQANHVATRNRNEFMRKFAPGVNSHWPAYQTVKTRFGFLSLLGHGAMVSRRCYDAVGGFPQLVAEDICFALEARFRGWLTVFAPDIICEEEFPVDYSAFRKRHKKWTEGNMEFIRKYTRKILFGRMHWYEKLDVVLFTYSLPLTGLFSIFVAINAIALPLMGFTYRYPLWMLGPTALFLMAPMLNDIFTYWSWKKADLLNYLLHSMALFGSVYFVSLQASFKTMFGGSKFNVTPKTSERLSLLEAVRASSKELIFGAVLAVAVSAASGSVLPVVFLVIPALFTVYLHTLSHEKA